MSEDNYYEVCRDDENGLSVIDTFWNYFDAESCAMDYADEHHCKASVIMYRCEGIVYSTEEE